jgi:hypothetical protein
MYDSLNLNENDTKISRLNIKLKKIYSFLFFKLKFILLLFFN